MSRVKQMAPVIAKLGGISIRPRGLLDKPVPPGVLALVTIQFDLSHAHFVYGN